MRRRLQSAAERSTGNKSEKKISAFANKKKVVLCVCVFFSFLALHWNMNEGDKRQPKADKRNMKICYKTFSVWMIKYGGGVQVKIKTKRNENDNECWRLFVTHFCEKLINIARRTVFFLIFITSLAALGLFRCLSLFLRQEYLDISVDRLSWAHLPWLDMWTLQNAMASSEYRKLIDKILKLLVKRPYIWNFLRNAFYQFFGSLTLWLLLLSCTIIQGKL